MPPYDGFSIVHLPYNGLQKKGILESPFFKISLVYQKFGRLCR